MIRRSRAGSRRERRWRLLAIIMLATVVSACPAATGNSKSVPAPSLSVDPSTSPTNDMPAKSDGTSSPAATAAAHALLRKGESPATLDPKLEPAHRSPQGRFVIVSGPTEHLSTPGVGWHTLSLLGPGTLAKVRNPHLLMRQLEQQGIDGPIVSCFVKLDAKKFSGDQALVKQALANLGFEARTVAGNIVTGSFTAAALGRVLAPAWVLSMELPRRFKLR